MSRCDVERYRKKMRKMGYLQRTFYLKKERHMQLKRIAVALDGNLNDALEKVFHDAYGDPQAQVICPDCGGFGCEQCKNIGWREN